MAENVTITCASAQVQVLTDLAANRQLVIEEPGE